MKAFFKRLARLHVMLWLMGLGLVILFLGPRLPVDYDSGTLHVIALVALFVLTFPFQIVGASLGEVLEGVRFGTFITVFLGCAIYVVADVILYRWASRGA